MTAHQSSLISTQNQPPAAFDWSWAFVDYRDIPGFPGYRVGNDGSVWTRFRNSGRPNGPWRRLTTCLTVDGYPQVSLKGGGRCVLRRIHTLVLMAFVGPCPPGMQACHKDGDRMNNHPDNLRWGTARSNIADRERHGNTAKGTRNGNCKIGDTEVAVARQLRQNGMSYERIGKRLGISKRQTMRIIKGEAWTHVVDQESTDGDRD